MPRPQCDICGASIHVEYEGPGEYTVAERCDNECPDCGRHECEALCEVCGGCKTGCKCVRCPNCLGTGEVPAPYSGTDPSCPTCGGMGWVIGAPG